MASKEKISERSADDARDVAAAMAIEARIAAGEGTVPGEVVKLMIEAPVWALEDQNG